MKARRSIVLGMLVLMVIWGTLGASGCASTEEASGQPNVSAAEAGEPDPIADIVNSAEPVAEETTEAAEAPEPEVSVQPETEIEWEAPDCF